jgi:hypothetical protein
MSCEGRERPPTAEQDGDVPLRHAIRVKVGCAVADSLRPIPSYRGMQVNEEDPECSHNFIINYMELGNEAVLQWLSGSP